MLLLEEYINDGTNPLLPSVLWKNNLGRWNANWFIRNGKEDLNHRVGAPSTIILKSTYKTGSQYFDDEGNFVDTENRQSIAVEEYSLFNTLHRLDGPSISEYYELNRYHIYGYALPENVFCGLQWKASLSGYPLWVELLIMKKIITYNEVYEVAQTIPGLFEAYPAQWVVSALNIKDAVEVFFQNFYEIVELEKQHAIS